MTFTFFLNILYHIYGLKITDGTFTSRHGVISLGGGEGIIEDGTYTIEFKSDTTSNVVYVYGNATLTIKGGEFTSDNSSGKANSGAAVLVNGTGATLTVEDGTFVGMNGMVSGNDNTTINGGSYDTVWDYNHYGNIEEFVSTGAVVEVAGETLTKNEDGTTTVLVAKIGDTYYKTLESAITAANNGATITLLRDVALSKTINVNIEGEITIDGNGHKITNNGATNAAVMLGNSGYENDTYKATRKVTLKNVVFDGWTTDHVVRAQGVTATIEGCTFINCNQTKGLGLLTLTFADATVSNCVFKNNNCVEVIDVNSWGDKSKADVTIKECTFENNTASGLYGLTGIIAAFYGDVSIENNDFAGNTAEINIVYTETNADVEGNYFAQNTLTSDAEKKAVVMAGPWHDGNYSVNINENAFADDYKGAYVEQFELYPNAVTAYNLSSNYWFDGDEPIAGTDYVAAGGAAVTLDDYYTEYTDGTLGGVEKKAAADPAFGTTNGVIKLDATEDNYEVVVLATIDSLNYKNVGLEVTFGTEKVTEVLDTVYEAVKAKRDENSEPDDISPSDFGGNGRFIFLSKVTFGINNDASETFSFRPFATKLDGTVIYGKTTTDTIGE